MYTRTSLMKRPLHVSGSACYADVAVKLTLHSLIPIWVCLVTMMIVRCLKPIELSFVSSCRRPCPSCRLPSMWSTLFLASFRIFSRISGFRLQLQSLASDHLGSSSCEVLSSHELVSLCFERVLGNSICLMSCLGIRSS